jgi:phage gpG-like protein
MGSVSIVEDIRDLGVEPMLARIEARTNDLQPLLKVFGERMELSIEETFAQGGRPVKWIASQRVRRAGDLEPTKRRIGGPLRTLVLSGLLSNTISYKTTRSELRIGSDLPYAAIQQLGGRIGPRVILPRGKKALSWPGGRHPVKKVNWPGATIPARPYLVVQPEDLAFFRAEIDAYLTRIAG